LSFANNIFLSKYYAISNENSDSWDLKSVSYQYLLDYFSARLPCYSISLFGSLATGLSLPTSDVDILITPIEGYPVPESLLGLIANDLYHAPWTSYCNYIPTAKIPVIKLIVDPFFKEIHNPVSKFKGTPLEEQLKLSFLIKFDITINMSGLYNTGMSSTNYMKSVINGQPKIAEVLIVLKYILEMAKLNEGYKGGISSYNLFIMLIGFLEEKQVNVAEISMGEMIIEFFKFFAYEFNPKHSVLRFEMSQKCVLSF
jgi:non-canonical poly(A) RNA polymerase PAPD5/7